MTVNSARVSVATDTALADDLADIAAATFPLACPPHSSTTAIAAFIATNLASANFRDYLAAPDADVLVAQLDSRVVGYALVLHREPVDPDVAAAVIARPTSEVSKCYVLPEHHGEGVSHDLMAASIDAARARTSAVVWLGVNEENVRAQRFYAKMGFHAVGVKTFDLGGNIEHDLVLAQNLSRHPG